VGSVVHATWWPPSSFMSALAKTVKPMHATRLND
jgi:hypothetical protein